MTDPTSSTRPGPAPFARLLLAASLASLLGLALHGFRAVAGSEYRAHQRAYRAALPQPGAFRPHLRQIVLPDRIDRCVSCHVGLENPAMADADQPLQTHPGSYLLDHEPSTIGCTLCHDGDGRALDRQVAHGRGAGRRPLIPMPFMAANCVRCHDPDEELPALETVRRGRALVAENQCLACHELDDRGGRLAPDLSRIGDAHPNQKAPVSFSSEELADRFGGSLNLAYIYESVQHARLQPDASFMPEFNFGDEDLTALTVFLKSLSEIGAPQALQARQWRAGTREILHPPVEPAREAGMEGEDGE